LRSCVDKVRLQNITGYSTTFPSISYAYDNMPPNPLYEKSVVRIKSRSKSGSIRPLATISSTIIRTLLEAASVH
jgi:hypothetical protein